MQTTCLLRYFQTKVKYFGQQETVREETRTAKAAVRATELRHGTTLQDCRHDGDRKDADRKIGGPRYALVRPKQPAGRGEALAGVAKGSIMVV
jgi:hypothetical protein